MIRSAPLAAIAAALALAACSPTSPSGHACPSGQERCGFVCVDPATYATDPANCGACGVACGGLGSCTGGSCQCDGGATLCAGHIPRCVNTSEDPANCGACGNDCPKAYEGCAAGVCGCEPPTPDDCGTFCADLQNDARNCGVCGGSCPLVNQLCVGAACACPAALPDVCGARCTTLASDEANCGRCGTACAIGATCLAGDCVCPAGEAVCGSACANRQTDPRNCGSCGAMCPSGAACTAGSCRCPAGPPGGCLELSVGEATCCAGGTSCCQDGACPTQHANGIGVPGLGQHFYDCLPLGTYSAAQAQKAASAWRASPLQAYPGNALACPSMDCLGWQTNDACAVWCYGNDALKGRVALNTISIACICPTPGSPNWN